MEPGRLQSIAIVKRSREFVESQMRLFVGMLLRGRVAGVAEGKPRLNFGSFNIGFESELDLKDGEIATFKVIELSKDAITLGFIRREGAPVPETGLDYTTRIKTTLTEMALPADEEHVDAARNLLKAGFAVSKENIRAVVTLKTDPAGDGEASRVLRGLLTKGTDIPPKLVAAVKEYISNLPDEPAQAISKPAISSSAAQPELPATAAKLIPIRGDDNLTVNANVISRRIAESSAPIKPDTPEEVASQYKAIAQTRVSSEVTISNVLRTFIPKYISAMHPSDPLRLVFEQFTEAAKEFTPVKAVDVETTAIPTTRPDAATPTPTPAATSSGTMLLPPLPKELMPVLIEYLMGDASLKESAEEMFAAFARYVRQALTPSDPETVTSSGTETRTLRGNIAMNIGRLINIIELALTTDDASPGKELITALSRDASGIATKLEGGRIAEWLITPARPGSENLPAVAFALPDGPRGTLSLYGGLKARDDEEDETPAGGRLVYEGEGTGRVEIAMEYGDDGLAATFITALKETSDEITSGLPPLQERLEMRGVKVKSLRSLHRQGSDRSIELKGQSPKISGLDVKA